MHNISDNVLIAIIAACGATIAAACVLGAGIFALIVNNKRLDGIEKRLDRSEQTLDNRLGGFEQSIDKRLGKIDHVLELIQTDMVKWSQEIFKIKQHVKMD